MKWKILILLIGMVLLNGCITLEPTEPLKESKTETTEIEKEIKNCLPSKGMKYTPVSDIEIKWNGTAYIAYEKMYGMKNFIENVPEDGCWKKYDKAKSLIVGKGFNVKYIKNDPKYKIDIKDFNSSSFDGDFSTVNSEKDKNIPIEIWKVNKSKKSTELTGDYRIDRIKVENTTVNLKSSLEKKEIKLNKYEDGLEFEIGDLIVFGPNTTIVTIEGNETTMGDAHIQISGGTGTNGYGGRKDDWTVGCAGDSTLQARYVFKMFDVGGAEGQTLSNCSIKLHVHYMSNSQSEAQNVSIHDLTQWFLEGNGSSGAPTPNSAVNWVNRDDGPVAWAAAGGVVNDVIGEFAVPNVASGAANFYIQSDLRVDVCQDNVDAITADVYTNIEGFQARSVGYDSASCGGGVSMGINTDKSEQTTASLRPVWYLEYTVAPPDTCTYTSGDWNVECSDNCTISTDVVGDGSNLNIGGDAGSFNLDAEIKGFNIIHTNNCVTTCQGAGNCFTI